MKKSLLFVLIAVLSAAFIMVGCSQATDSEPASQGLSTPGSVTVDQTVEDTIKAQAALDDKDVTTVALVLKEENSPYNTIATAGIIVPAGKTLYLLNSTTDPQTLTPSTSGIIVEGAIVVSESTTLAALPDAKVHIVGSGVIHVQAGGTLAAKTRLSVNDLPLGGANVKSALISGVIYDRKSTLAITGEGDTLTIGDIRALWGDFNAASRSVVGVIPSQSNLEFQTGLTQVKPSDFATFTGQEGRQLYVKPAAPETSATLTIPAGIKLEPESSLAGITTLNVEGILKAESVGSSSSTSGVLVRVGANATLTVTSPINFNKTGSEIAGAFNGKSATGDIPTVAGATVNGSVVGSEKVVIWTQEISPQPVSLATGTTYQIQGKVEVSGDLTIPAGATLLIPEGAKLEFITNGTTYGGIAATSAGKVIVDGGTVSEQTTKSAGIPSLNVTTGANPPKLTLYAEKDLATGEAIIRLSGKVPGLTVTRGQRPTNLPEGFNVAGSAAPTNGKWSWATINILNAVTLGTTTVQGGTGTHIRQTNQSLRYYKGNNSDNTDLTAPKADNTPSIIINGPNDSVAYKWKVYTALSALDYEFLIWSEAPTKTARIEVTPKTASP
ncbi:MAG: hypothetical protein LBC60_09400, partial [Spirochaetaceae bacterium]|nr:hypothetical protein [Spirochaetaceae bacterium]